MNGKPVLHRNAKTVLSLKAPEFAEKLLCDGLVLNPGDSCAYSCAFCYVESLPLKFLVRGVLKEHEKLTGEYMEHSDAVIRRTNPMDVLLGQLLSSSVKKKSSDGSDSRVVFSSSTVD